MQSTFCLIHLLFYPLDELPMCMLSSIYFNFLVENMKTAVGKNCTTVFTDTDCTDIQLLYFLNRHIILLLLFSHSVTSDFLQPHGLQHASLPCPSKSSGVGSLMSIESVMPSNYLIPFHLLLFLPSVFSSIRVFCNESALCIRWPKFWSFSISPYNEYSGLTSFSIDWFDLLF